MSGRILQKLTMDGGARKNLSIYNKKKRGLSFLIPRCPSGMRWVLRFATEDFNKGYSFSIDGTLVIMGIVSRQN